MGIGIGSSFNGEYMPPSKEDLLIKQGIIKKPYSEEMKDKAHNEKDPLNCECETCKRRKYVDGSNEMVSFKSAAHIDPQAAYSVVRAHEGEHVTNAYNKAKMGDGKVLSANVAIHTARCPECGRIYVSGGTTYTQIRYYKNNPYSQNSKSLDAAHLKGKKIDSSI